MKDGVVWRNMQINTGHSGMPLGSVTHFPTFPCCSSEDPWLLLNELSSQFFISSLSSYFLCHSLLEELPVVISQHLIGRPNTWRELQGPYKSEICFLPYVPLYLSLNLNSEICSQWQGPLFSPSPWFDLFQCFPE